MKPPLETVAPATDICAREQVHLIGQIQGHGVLLALSEPDLIVRYASANIEAEFGLTCDDVLGTSLGTVLGARQFDRFRAHVAAPDVAVAGALRLAVGKKATAVNCVVHRNDDLLIVEFELLENAYSLEPLNLAADIQAPLTAMEGAADALALCAIAAGEIRQLSGFDRVMVYRFDPEWNGEVIAESAAPATSAYLGLRFPASDIPAQARRLFLVNPLRAIADVASEPVPIVSQSDAAPAGMLDLTRSFLRTASAVHVQYLKNMEVGSSMTVSVIVGQRLWGMIAAHGSGPRQLDFSTRSVCGMVGRVFALQLGLRLEITALQTQLLSRTRRENYMAGIEASALVFGAQPFEAVRLLELLNADGLISRIDGIVSYHATPVDEHALLPVLAKLRKFASRGIASSNMLKVLDQSAEPYAQAASGALFMGLSETSDDYLLLVRRELEETVSWAGDPDKAAAPDDAGRLRPRTSFKAWKETVRGRARQWSELELESARFLREQIVRLRSIQLLRKAGPGR